MRTRSRMMAAVTAAGLVAGLIGNIPASADHNANDHSKNIKELARKPIKISKDLFAEGSDLAFQRRLLLAGSYQGTGFYKMLRRKPYLRQIGFHACPGAQGDVSVWGKLAFVSIDSASTNNGSGAGCNDTKATGPGDTTHQNSEGLEGVRIINIKNPRRPRQVGFVETHCGSHTHVLVPHGRKLFIYVNSYPLGAPTGTCSTLSHGKISVIQVNKSNPVKSDVVSTPPVRLLPGGVPIGCHDLTVFPKKDLAAVACITENQIWDISKPKNPEILAHIPMPEGMQIAHSASFTWDGKYVIFSDEYGGAAGGGGCAGDKDSNIGAMFFYKIRNPESPTLKGHYSLPRIPPFTEDEATRTQRCTTHLYNILPMKNRRKYIAASSYYMGGLSVVNFTDPANPKERAHFMPREGGVLGDMWAAYWYNGRIYTNEKESRRGVSVFRMKGKGKKSVRYFKGRYNPQVQIPRFK